MVRLLDATIARFVLRLNCLLEVHRDLRALNVHALPPMRDDTSSNRGLEPKVACGTTPLHRLDGTSMSRCIRLSALAANLRPRPPVVPGCERSVKIK